MSGFFNRLVQKVGAAKPRVIYQGPSPAAGGQQGTSSSQMDSVTSSNPMTTKIIQEAIRIGVPLFNRGDVAGCARVYSQAALAAISKGASQMDAHRLSQALTQATKPGVSSSDCAWALRRAFDEILGRSVTGSGSVTGSQINIRRDGIPPVYNEPAPGQLGSGGNNFASIGGSAVRRRGGG